MKLWLEGDNGVFHKVMDLNHPQGDDPDSWETIGENIIETVNRSFMESPIQPQYSRRKISVMTRD